jgi:mannobiose 2-epimerase
MTSVEQFREVLWRHVVDPWFPRCIDREHGGFFCDYDRAWNNIGPNQKLLEFQARQTLFAAEAARFAPDHAGLRDAAMHGFRFLRDTLWDAEYGGWFHSVDRLGKPLEHSTKHMHGFAYALSACSAVHQLNGDEDAYRLAQKALDWMDQFARDREHGGYFGYVTRDGRVIRSSADAPNGSELDTVGTEVAFKDLNVHSDLLETFALMYRAWPEPAIGERLAEFVDIIAERMVNPTTGSMHFFVTPDWRPVPHLIRVGYQSHSAFRLVLAKGLTAHDALILRMAVRLLDSAIRYARDSNGQGYYYAATGALPQELQGTEIRATRRTWWVQFEVLKALVAVRTIAPDDERYGRLFDEQWRYIRKHFIDTRHGGVYMHGLDNARVWQRKFGARLAPAGITRKGDVWKDASHEGRTMLYCLQTLGAQAT